MSFISNEEYDPETCIPFNWISSDADFLMEIACSIREKYNVPEGMLISEYVERDYGFKAVFQGVATPSEDATCQSFLKFKTPQDKLLFILQHPDLTWKEG